MSNWPAVDDLRTVLPELAQTPVIGIVRRCPARHVVSTVAAVVGEGVRFVEVTLDSENALESIAKIRAEVSGVVVGVGSVVNADQAGSAVKAGARFVVSPITDRRIIQTCRALDVPALPGAATPTEIAEALRWGATAVKVFPIVHLGGVGYVRSVLSPLQMPPLIPTGGVTAENAAGYLDAGAVAVGAGSDLFPSTALLTGDLEVVAHRARRWVEAVR